jgi:hypothetical protein
MQNSLRGEGSYNFRTVPDYIIPFYRTNLREKCIRVRGPKEWSRLPDVGREATSISSFKSYFFNFVVLNY